MSVPNFAKVAADVQQSAMAALMDAGEHLLTEANKTVPFDEGTLARSGKVTPDQQNAQVVVSYDTPYAIRQHEDTRLAHPNGRRAKWLQLTLAEQAPAIQKFLADRLSGLL